MNTLIFGKILGYRQAKFSNFFYRGVILMSLILGQLVTHWLLIGVEKKGSIQKKGSEMTTLIFGKFQIWGIPKQNSLTFFPMVRFL